MIVGDYRYEGPAVVTVCPPETIDGWCNVRSDPGYTFAVHIRNIDRILANERRCTPRVIKAGDEVDITLRVKVRDLNVTYQSLDIPDDCYELDFDDPRVRPVDRRVKDLGRSARKNNA